MLTQADVHVTVEDNHFNLTSGNFTFLKDPLGMNDPNLEIIREAKKKVETCYYLGKESKLSFKQELYKKIMFFPFSMGKYGTILSFFVHIFLFVWIIHDQKYDISTWINKGDNQLDFSLKILW